MATPKRKDSSPSQEKAIRIKKAKIGDHLRDFVDRFPPELALVPKEEDKEPVKVNAILLCWKSHPFCSALGKDRPDRLDMKEWSAASLQILVDFLLTGKCQEIESSAVALEVAALAHQYDLSTLEEEACLSVNIKTRQDFEAVLRHIEMYNSESLDVNAFCYLKTLRIDQLEELEQTHADQKVFERIHDQLLNWMEKKINKMEFSCCSSGTEFLESHQNWSVSPQISLVAAIRHFPAKNSQGKDLQGISSLKSALDDIEVGGDIGCLYCGLIPEKTGMFSDDENEE